MKEGKRITFRTTSTRQYQDLTAYAVVKGFKSLSDFALYAAVAMTSKNPLTDAQKSKAEEVLADLQNDR